MPFHGDVRVAVKDEVIGPGLLQLCQQVGVVAMHERQGSPTQFQVVNS